MNVLILLESLQKERGKNKESEGKQRGREGREGKGREGRGGWERRGEEERCRVEEGRSLDVDEFLLQNGLPFLAHYQVPCSMGQTLHHCLQY